jgi:hypothetical protein
MGDGGSKAREIDLGDDNGDVLVKVNGARIEVDADGNFRGLPAPVNDSPIKGTLEIGAIEPNGDHKGEIYGDWSKEYGDGYRSIWFSPASSRLIDHYAAAAWARARRFFADKKARRLSDDVERQGRGVHEHFQP